MSFASYLAGQLRQPKGFFGRLTVRILNRQNAGQNQATLDALDLRPDDWVLEVGFGGGDLIARMAPVVSRGSGSITGADFSQDMVALCAKRFASLVREDRLELHVASGDALPFEDESFTKACCVNTIYFWPDAAVQLAELQRVLRAGGRLVASFSPPATIERLPATKHGFTLYEPEEARRLYESVGFAGVEVIRGGGRRGEFVCVVGTKPG
jgi:arsenite methyltransferase